MPIRVRVGVGVGVGDLDLQCSSPSDIAKGLKGVPLSRVSDYGLGERKVRVKVEGRLDG